MSHFHRLGARVAEREDQDDHPRSPFADVAERFASWFTGVDRSHDDGRYGRPEDTSEHDPLQALLPPVDHEEEAPARFPVAPFGYSRAAVDEHLAELESELEQLRIERRPAAPSINEELERIGEQTASILVVAHDKASETTRRAQEQAERCVADARANAAAITEEAQRRLRELDTETDSVWRERERLIDDVRMVSAALNQLADEASERFPAAADQPQTAAFGAAYPAAGISDLQDPPAYQPPIDPDATQDWPAPNAPDRLDGSSQDTGSWLAGLEPPPEPPAGR